MYSFTYVSCFCEITTAKMMTIQEIIVFQSQAIGKSALLNFALDTETGPCRFLTPSFQYLVENHKKFPSFMRSGNVIFGQRYMPLLVIHNHPGYQQSRWSHAMDWIYRYTWSHPINHMVIGFRLILSTNLTHRISYSQMKTNKSREEWEV
jgi:hypothetical protein